MAEKWDDRAMYIALGGREEEDLSSVIASQDVLPDWGWTDEQKEKYVEKHKELGRLLDYPPFTINRAKYKQYMKDIGDEAERVHRTGEIDRPFSTLEVKWKDDLDEAMLYYKRYANPLKAQDAAIELNKMDRDRDDEDIYPIN